MYRYAKIHGENATFAALQSELSDAAASKLPALYAAGAFFTRRGIEQCSSEQTAAYKASLFSGKRMLSLASGLGVDDIAFSAGFEEIISVDPDVFLNTIARYNFDLLGITNIHRTDSSAEAFLASDNSVFDLIYIDPDRRSGQDRQILLKDHVPDVCSLAGTLLNRCSQLLIKCSPMYDYQMAEKEIPGISHIYSISKQGEMKEMLLLSEKNHSADTPLMISCADISSGGNITEFTVSDSDDSGPVLADEISGYLFEAGAALIKMRKHRQYAGRQGFKALDKTIAFYCTETVPRNAFGKLYSIVKVMPYKTAGIKDYLKSQGIRRANLKVRGLKFNTADMYAKTGLKEGGDDFLFALPFKGDAVLLHLKQHRN